MKWNPNAIMLRTVALMAKMPHEIGLDGATATVSALSVRAVCLEVVRSVSARVARAVQCPAPDPEWGDGGSREAAREWALDDLEAAERWAQFHEAHRWRFDVVKRYPSPDRVSAEMVAEALARQVQVSE